MKTISWFASYCQPPFRLLKPFFEPVSMMLASPFGIQVHHLPFSIYREQCTQGVHFLKYLPDIFFGIVMLAIAMRNKIIDEVFLCLISPPAFPTAAGKVIHKISQHFLRGNIHQPAQQEKRIREYEPVFGIAVVGAGLPF